LRWEVYVSQPEPLCGIQVDPQHFSLLLASELAAKEHCIVVPFSPAMSEILDTVQSFYDVAKWVYDQLSTMKENRAEAQALAERVHRLSDVALALKTHLQPGLVQLSPEIRACLTHVEEYFAELDCMLSAHTGQSYPQGIRGKARAAFAKAKEFFGAQNWKEQLMAADATLTKVLGDLHTSMAAQNLTISVNTNQGVQRVEGGVNDLKAMMQELQLLQSVAAAHSPVVGLRTYAASDITNKKKIGKGGFSRVYEANYPHSIDRIVYKRCSSIPLACAFAAYNCIYFSCSESSRQGTERKHCGGSQEGSGVRLQRSPQEHFSRVSTPFFYLFFPSRLIL
jgi:hypothetical protein